MRIRALAWVVAVLCGCGGDDDRPDGGGTDAGRDAGAVDAGRDAGMDARTIGGVDAGTDAGPDAGAADVGPVMPCEPGSVAQYVVTRLHVAQEDPAGEPGTVAGFNLDGRISDDGDALGCYHTDWMSPPPDSEPGVDNQLGPIMGSLGSSVDVDGMSDEAIANGDFLMLVRLRGDDLGACSVDLARGLMPEGTAMPVLTPEGRLAPGQTFDVDARTVGPEGVGTELFATAALDAGRLSTTSTARVTLAFRGGGDAVPLPIQEARLRFDPVATALTHGVLGGPCEVDEVVAAFATVLPEYEDLLRNVLQMNADLDPEPPSGECARVSVAYTFDAVWMIEGVTRTP